MEIGIFDMTYLLNNFRRGFRYVSSDKGVTLIELMVAMGVAGIVLMAIYSAYHTQTLMNRKQTVVLNMQQNLRGGLYLMEREIRMAGYDRNATGNFGITDIRFRDINNVPNQNGNSAITFTSDLDGDGVLDGNETISFSIYDYPVTSPDGVTDLAMDNGGNRQLAAESIQALFMAYAYDNDGDGLLDTSDGVNVIWAIDSNNDNILDQDVNTGASLGGSGVAVGNIRAVRVWFLARTKTPMLKDTDNTTYTVGNKTITPNDNYKRELLVTTIKCRNLGMNQ
jgi:type IV pilus assembly protein PilW